MDWTPTYPNIIVCAQSAPPIRLFNKEKVYKIILINEVIELEYVRNVASILPTLTKELEYSPSVTRWGLLNYNISSSLKKPSYFGSWAFVFSGGEVCR